MDNILLGLMGAAMNLVEYVTIFDSPTVDEFSSLRRKIGWKTGDFDMVKKSLDNSLFHVVIRDELKLIGMARIIGDGSMYFYIQDVVVDPDYQNKGIGSLLMEQIEGYLKRYARKGATIGLLAAKGKEDFYTRFEYTQRPNDSLGHGMCKFA